MTKNSEQELHQLLDDSFTKLKDDLEIFFQKHQDAIFQEQSDFYQPKIDALEEELEDRQNEHERMKNEIQENTSELERKKAILQNMINRSSILHRKVRNANVTSRSFHSWIENGTSKVLLIRRFESIYIKNAILRIMFRKWVRKMHRKRDVRVEMEARLMYERESRARSAEYNAQIDLLERELANARHELESKQKSFIDMQQKLRKAFMRGVVNLNLEAMDVFNGAQFMGMAQEVEGKSGGTHDSENEIEEGDEEFYVEESPNIAVIRH